MGAPEAVLVGIVALIVFGPKGLAEAVKAVGATLRTFQPTIRELASVSSDLRSTLEEQIGLDEIRAELSSAVSPIPPATAPAKPTAAGLEAGAGGGDGAPTDGTGAAPGASLPDAVAAMQGAGSDGDGSADPDIEAKRAASAAAAWDGVVPTSSSAAVPAPAPGRRGEGAGEEDSLLGDVPLDALEAELARRRRGQA